MTDWGWSDWGWLHWIRRSLAVLLLVAGTYLTSTRTVCEEKLATGSQGTVRVCHSLAVTDAPVLAGLFLVLLFLLPDLSEVGIPGFLSLKRQVSQQESKIEEQTARLGTLQAQLAQAIESQQIVSQKVDTRAAVTNFNLLDPDGVLREFQAKARSELAGSGGHQQHPGEVIPAERAQLEARLLRIWAQLRPPIAEAERLRGAIDAQRAGAEAQLVNLLHDEKNLGTEMEALSNRGSISGTAFQRLRTEQAQIHRAISRAERALLSLSDEAIILPAWKWNRDFQQEIEVVRAAYDAVVRSEPIEDNKLRAAVRLAEGLLEAWRGRSDGRSKALEPVFE